jgi:hypothetical protein
VTGNALLEYVAMDLSLTLMFLSFVHCAVM